METRIEARYLTPWHKIVHYTWDIMGLLYLCLLFHGYCSDLAVNRTQEQAISVELGNDSFNWILRALNMPKRQFLWYWCSSSCWHDVLALMFCKEDIRIIDLGNMIGTHGPWTSTLYTCQCYTIGADVWADLGEVNETALEAPGSAEVEVYQTTQANMVGLLPKCIESIVHTLCNDHVFL